MAKFHYLKKKDSDNLYGIIWQGQVCVEHIPYLWPEGVTLKDIEREVDLFVPNPFEDYDYLTIEL